MFDFLQGMNALTLVLVSCGVFAIAYRMYGIFLANKVLRLSAERVTPAVKYADGHDYVKTQKYVLYGHHFAAIAAAGPLLGPVLAAQFGFLPGAIWIIFGCVFAGAVHDMVVLFASVRHKGMSLASIAKKEIGPVTGTVASFGILSILILTLAGLSIACVNAMHSSAWASFTVFITMPIAIIMGIYMHVWREGDVLGASLLGFVLLVIGILVGPYVAADPTWAKWFTWDKPTLSLMIPAYGFIASVLPVWLLLCPRDYLSTYLKIGTVVMLAVGILFVRPDLLMDPVTKFIHGGGPIIGGPLFPFIFITIACGAISGFHAIIATGTTPKMIGNEREILFVGYGAMLTEGFVAIMALIAACTLVPADYFAINTPNAEVFATLGMTVQDLPRLATEVQENIMHRPGGAVSLAVGMAHIFSSIPFMENLMGYWYHFAIMFEAVFILTAVDTGTRVGRFFLQEMIGAVIPKFNDKHWWPGIFITSAIFTASWGYLVYTGDIGSIWPLFGMSNQLLASCGLIVATTMLIRLDRKKYAWCTAIPGIFMAGITLWAGYLQIFTMYWPQKKYLLAYLGMFVVVLMVFVFIGTFMRWRELLTIKTTVVDDYGDTVLELVEE